MDLKRKLTIIKKKITTISFLLNEIYYDDYPNDNRGNLIQNICPDSKEIDEIEKSLAKEYQHNLGLALELNERIYKPMIYFLSIKDIKQKVYIDVKEFEKLFGYGKSWQAQRRSRLHNPLPKASMNRNKILYELNVINEWFKTKFYSNKIILNLYRVYKKVYILF